MTAMVANEHSLVAGMYGGGVSILDTATQVWSNTLVVEGGGDVNALALMGDSLLFVGTGRGRLFFSEDMGQSWEQLDFEGRHSRIYSMVVDQNVLYIGTDVGLSSFDVDGQNFYEHALSEDTLNDKPIFCLTATSDLVAAGSRGVVYTKREGDGFMASDTFTEADILDLEVHNDRLIAATSGDYFYARPLSGSRDWRQRQNERSSSITYAMVSYEGRLYKGSNGRGVIEAEQSSEEGIEEEEVISLCIFGDKVYAGTRGKGIFEKVAKPKEQTALTPPPPAGIRHNSEQAEVNADQFSVYPNPADQRINVVIPDADGSEIIVIYDVAGRMVYRSRESNPSHIINLNWLQSGEYELVVALRGRRTALPFVVAR